MRIGIHASVVTALLWPAGVMAAPACGPLQQLNQIQLQAWSDGRREFIPVSINGTEKLFLFDTGAFVSSMARSTADELKLPVHQGNIILYTTRGEQSRDQTAVRDFTFGKRKASDTEFPVLSRTDAAAGLFGLDFVGRYDMDLDFGTDMLRVFSQDHCEGGVLYWQAPAVGIVPMRMLNGHITVKVSLDGREIDAIIDTGATDTAMSADTAKFIYRLELGAAGTEVTGDFAGDPNEKVYQHRFDNLAFGDIQVKNAQVAIIPDLMNKRGERQQQAGNRAKLYGDEIKLPELIVGMNVLRKLHIYVAFGENRMYVSPATPVPAAAAAANAMPAPAKAAQ
jgi:predicted aspartyl protease